MHRTGEKHGIGTYECTNCGQQKVLDDHDDRLPPCVKCHGTEWTKVG
jgi:ribosomal protein S27AE